MITPLVPTICPSPPEGTESICGLGDCGTDENSLRLNGEGTIGLIITGDGERLAIFSGCDPPPPIPIPSGEGGRGGGRVAIAGNGSSENTISTGPTALIKSESHRPYIVVFLIWPLGVNRAAAAWWRTRTLDNPLELLLGDGGGTSDNDDNGCGEARGAGD